MAFDLCPNATDIYSDIFPMNKLDKRVCLGANAYDFSNLRFGVSVDTERSSLVICVSSCSEIT